MDQKSVDQALSTTRSVRRRLDFDRPVSPSLLEECIDVATQAPTGLNRENWRFLVVTDPEPRRELGELYRRAFDAVLGDREALARRLGEEPPPLRPTYRALAERIQDFPAIVLVCALGEPEPGDRAQQVAFYGSVLPAAWSLMVALRARGLGSTWTTLHLRESDAAARVLSIPDGVTQTVLLPVAWTRDARLRPADRKPAREVTFWNRWGAHRDEGP